MKNLKDNKTCALDLSRKIIREVITASKNLNEPLTEIDMNQITNVFEYGNGKVGIELSDGTVIPFEMSAQELALIKSVALENRKKGIVPSEPILQRPLTEEEKQRILTERIREVWEVMPLFFAAGSFGIYLFGIAINVTGWDNKLVNFIFFSLALIYEVTCIVVWCFLFLFMKAKEKEVQALKALKNRNICRLSNFWFNNFCQR